SAVKPEETRWRERHFLPAIDFDAIGEIAHALVKQRRGTVHQPATYDDAVIASLGFNLGDRKVVRAERGGMQERDVRCVEKVIDEQQVVAVHMPAIAGKSPVLVVHPIEVGNQGRISFRWITHPDPNEMLSLDDWI